MRDSKLRLLLQPIVQEYGLGSVLESLGQIADSQRSKVELGTPLGNNIAHGTKQKAAKITAPEYVRKMDIPTEKVATVAELARRYHRKSFLPTFSDISSFCQMYDVQAPASKGRANAIPRVFKLISELEPQEIQQILDDGMFSGPSTLGPIAEGIRNYSHAVPYDSLG